MLGERLLLLMLLMGTASDLCRRFFFLRFSPRVSLPLGVRRECQLERSEFGCRAA